MARSSRSLFIAKLHAILEECQHPNDLKWVSPTSFEISADDTRAIAALTAWEFKSLSSFIRQLSYYGFKRLSDRRRASERRGAAGNSIIFTHPSGFFCQGDASQLDNICRKTRVRKPSSGSRNRQVSQDDSADQESPSPPYAGEYEDQEPLDTHSRRTSNSSGYSAPAPGSAAAGPPRGQWAPPAPGPSRQKHPSQLQQGGSLVDWQGQATGRHSPSSYQNLPHQSSFAQFPPLPPQYYPQSSNNEAFYPSDSFPSTSQHHQLPPLPHQPMAPYPQSSNQFETAVHSRGALIAPPSPESFTSGSPRGSEPDEQQQYYDKRHQGFFPAERGSSHMRGRSLDSNQRVGELPPQQRTDQPHPQQFYPTAPPSAFGAYDIQALHRQRPSSGGGDR